MNILVLAEDYPSESRPYALSYIHSRLLAYQEKGVRCTVLSFKTAKEYRFEGITVVASVEDVNRFDVVVSHAPNLKNHIRFLLSNINRYSRVVFWIHGHEVMNVFTQYPKPYRWAKKERIRRFFHMMYSPFKLLVLKLALLYLKKRVAVHYVFVSEWMRDVFYSNIFSLRELDYSVIYNPISQHFSGSSFAFKQKKVGLKGICIRPWDNSKYAVDMVVNFFKNNPELECDVYGSGLFPKFNKVPDNIEFIPKFLTQSELPSLISNYDFAILPTRLDAQGVLACEMATFGIPLIVNDIPIMKEMLNEFPNVIFIDDSNFSGRFSTDLFVGQQVKITKFFPDVIVDRELRVISGLV